MKHYSNTVTMLKIILAWGVFLAVSLLWPPAVWIFLGLIIIYALYIAYRLDQHQRRHKRRR